jgi:hypothetical protein
VECVATRLAAPAPATVSAVAASAPLAEPARAAPQAPPPVVAWGVFAWPTLAVRGRLVFAQMPGVSAAAICVAPQKSAYYPLVYVVPISWLFVRRHVPDSRGLRRLSDKCAGTDGMTVPLQVQVRAACTVSFDPKAGNLRKFWLRGGPELRCPALLFALIHRSA